MKVKSRVYRGIEFVFLHDLPAEQQVLFNSSTPERIKILMDGVVVECISYSAYTEWFKVIYKAPKPVQEKTRPAEHLFIPKENQA
jgi:hypothetical protein